MEYCDQSNIYSRAEMSKRDNSLTAHYIAIKYKYLESSLYPNLAIS